VALHAHYATAKSARTAPVEEGAKVSALLRSGVALGIMIAFCAKAAPTAEPPAKPKLSAEQVARLEKLVEQLGADNYGKREAATKAIRRFGKPAIPALRHAFKSSDFEVSHRARQLLLELDVAFKLALDLESPDRGVRSRAVGALGKLGPDARAAIPALLKALDDRDVYVARGVASALGRIGLKEKGVLAGLARAMQSKHKIVRREAASIFETHYKNEAAVRAVARLLRHADPSVNKLASKTLRGMGSRSIEVASAEIEKALADKRRSVRCQAALIYFYHRGPLHTICGRKVVGVLAETLRSGELAAKRELVFMFSWNKGPIAALPLLRLGLDSEDYTVRARSIRALNRMRGRACPALPRLIELLENREEEVGDAVKYIAIGSRRELPAFEGLLTHKNIKVRAAAAEQIWRITGDAKRTLPILLEALKEGGRTQERAVLTVKDMGIEAAEAVPQLIALLEKGADRLSEGPALALAEMGEKAKKAVPALQKALTKGDTRTRYSAAIALVMITGRSDQAEEALFKLIEAEHRSTYFWAGKGLWQLSDLLSDDAVPRLAKLVKEGDKPGNSAVVALRFMGSRARAAAPALADYIIREGRGAYCSQASNSLAAIGRPAVPDVLRILEAAKDKLAVWHPCEALGRIGADAEAAVPALSKLLRHPKIYTRCCAALALYRIIGKTDLVLPVLIAEVEGKDEYFMHWKPSSPKDKGKRSYETVSRAFKALSQIGPKARGAVPALLKAMESKYSGIRQEAASALGNITPCDPRVISALTKALTNRDRSELRAAAARGLGKAGVAAREAAPALEGLLEDRWSTVRRAAAYAHWQVTGKPDHALRILTANLLDPGDYSAPNDARLLGEMGSAAKAAVPILKKARDSTGRKVSFASAVALWRITGKTDRSLSALCAGLRVRNWYYREQAAKALAEMGPAAKPAVSQLEQMLLFEHPRLREEARKALRKIQGRKPE
jgi:HEAT repeat protein